MKQRVRKAIIPAAGLGTRFLPATKSQPKEMLPIVDKPTLQYIIEEAIESGIEEILIVTGRSKKSIEDHFDRSVELELELEQKGKTEMLKMVQDISNMVNIHRTYYSMIENGRRNPSLKVAVSIKKALNYQYDDIFEKQ